MTDSVPTYLVAAQQRTPPFEHELVAMLRKTNAERAWRRLHREDSFRCMHLVASFEDHPSRRRGSRQSVLCSLRYYAHTGLLCTTPGFSTPVDVDEEGPEVVAFKGGPKLSTYRVVIGGALFEYTIDNVSDPMPIADVSDRVLMREFELQEEKLDSARMAVAAAREGDGGSQEHYFADLKLSGVVKRKLVLMEIVSASDIVASDPVFVEVHLQLPRKQDTGLPLVWRLRTQSREPATKRASAARTRLALSSRSSTGNAPLTVFNFHTKFDLELCKSSDKQRPSDFRAAPDRNEETYGCGDLLAVPSPMLTLRTFSRDSWGRERSEGFGQLALPSVAGYHDCVVRLAKPILPIREQLEEFFLGRDESEDAGEQLLSSSTTLRGVNSRLGVQVQTTSAAIRVRFNIVEQSPSYEAASPDLSFHGAGRGTAGSRPAHVRPHALPTLRVVKRSVNEILQSVRLEKRLSQLSGVDPLSSLSAPGAAAVKSALTRLNAMKPSVPPSAEAHNASV